MLVLDVLVRYPAVALLLGMVFFCMRDARGSVQGWLCAFTSLSMAAVLLGTAPEPLKLSEPFFTIVRWLDTPKLALLWIFGLSLFRDNFKIGAAEWAGLALYTCVIGVIRAQDLGYIAEVPDVFGWLATAFSAGFCMHLIWVALAGRKEDLVESRRNGRLWFALGLTMATAFLVIAGEIYKDSRPDMISYLRALVVFVMVIWGWVWLSSLRPERFLFQAAAPAPRKIAAIDPRDQGLHTRIVTLMEDEQFFTRQGLTIRVLSEHLKVPEHQLRVLINQGMGYRNFAAFLNHYRIGYAKQVLADRERSRLPVLTIAMDAGFNSLAPFNRAFKLAEGVTPSAFRKAHLSR